MVFRMFPLVSVVVGMLGVLACGTEVVEAQARCAPCSVSFEHLADIGFHDMAAPITSEFAALYALRDGQYLSIDRSAPGTLRFHNGTGAVVRVLEADGQGPGEYRGIHQVAWTDDGYLIYDVAQSRLTWVDEGFHFRRSVPATFSAWRMFMLPDGRAVMNTLVPEHAPAGHMLHVRPLEGPTHAAFGGQGRPVDMRRDRASLSRVITVDSEGNIWSAMTNDYRLTRFSPAGDTLSAFEYERDWFDPWTARNMPNDLRSGPPSTFTQDALIDADGLLWLVFHEAARDWRQAVTEADSPTGYPDRRRMWDTVIEVIDPSSGGLVASARYPEALMAVGASGHTGQVRLYHVEERTDYSIGMSVLRASLTQAER